MSKRRIPSAERRTRRSAVGSSVTPPVAAGTLKKAGVTDPKNQKFLRFLGLSLSGGKSDKACLAVVDYYPDSDRLFLNRIFDRIKAEEFISADHKVHELIQQFSEHAQSLAFDVPLSFPVCIECALPCPGYETCMVPQIKWMRNLYQESEKRKPKKLFTPYTQRPVDLWLQQKGEEGLDIQHAFGANLAPLVARAHFIRRRLQLDCFETNPKIAVLRLGAAMKVNKSQLKVYRNSVGGDEARRIILQAMNDQLGIFFYVHDLKLMTENFHAFESFVCAFTGYLRFQDRTQSRPPNFPRNEIWVEIPREKE
jgi:hypothetical protein